MDSFTTLGFEDLASLDSIEGLSDVGIIPKPFRAATSEGDAPKNEEMDIRPGALCTIC
ncbi:hypothetical protein MD484_g4044, partial [Candolleomyces efflorescens]